MKIAVVGATGNIGFPLAQKLLAAGCQVRALSRGGPKLDELVRLGAEPFSGSFDKGTQGVEAFFDGADAAFTMVKSDWTNWHHHYPAVAKRLANALRRAPSVARIVNLSAFGADVDGDTGHSYCFYELEQTLNQLDDRRIVHVRGGWFMENFFEYYDSIARYGKMPAYFSPKLKLPLVAAKDIHFGALDAILDPPSEKLTIREIGSDEMTMPQAADIIAREIGKHVEYMPISRTHPDVRQAFIEGNFGPVERFDHEAKSWGAFDDGVCRFHTNNRRPLPTKMADYVREKWKPAYEQVVANLASRPEDFNCWLAVNGPLRRTADTRS